MYEVVLPFASVTHMQYDVGVDSLPMHHRVKHEPELHSLDHKTYINLVLKKVQTTTHVCVMFDKMKIAQQPKKIAAVFKI